MSWDLLPYSVRLVVALLILTAPFALAAWVVLPLDRAARYRSRAVQFTTLDFLGLVFVMQLPLGLVRLAIPTGLDKASLSLPIAFCMMLSALIWWTGVQMFSRAGIADPKHRARLIFFVLPVAYFAPLVSITLAAMLLEERNWDDISSGWAAVALVTQCALYLAIWHAGRISRRVVAATANSLPASDVSGKGNVDVSLRETNGK